MIGDGIEQFHQVGGGQFAAQMQEMLGFQQPGIRQRVQVAHAVLEGGDSVLFEAEITQAERIQHRGHSADRALRVMGDHRRAGRPARVAARLDLALEIVGMHVDHAGHQHVAVHVERALGVAAAGLHLEDGGAIKDDGAVDDGVREHDSCVCQYCQDRHAAWLRGETCRTLSATASRTSLS